MGARLFLWLAVFLAITHPLSAALLIYEPFDYTSGSPIDGQNGGWGFGSTAWEQNNAGQSFIQSGSLHHGDQITKGNSALIETDEGGDSLTRSFPKIVRDPGNRIWASILLRMPTTSSPEFTPEDTASMGLFGSVRGFQLGVFSDPDNNDQLVFGIKTYDDVEFFSTELFEAGITYSLVVSIEWAINPSISDDILRLFLNPISEPDDSLAIVTAPMKLGNSAALGQLTKAEFSSNGNGAEWQFDELRIGTTFQDVVPVPEPSAAILFGAALGGLGWSRWRSRIKLG